MSGFQLPVCLSVRVSVCLSRPLGQFPGRSRHMCQILAPDLIVGCTAFSARAFIGQTDRQIEGRATAPLKGLYIRSGPSSVCGSSSVLHDLTCTSLLCSRECDQRQACTPCAYEQCGESQMVIECHLGPCSGPPAVLPGLSLLGISAPGPEPNR